jgi:hypothetical protein
LTNGIKDLAVAWEHSSRFELKLRDVSVNYERPNAGDEDMAPCRIGARCRIFDTQAEPAWQNENDPGKSRIHISGRGRRTLIRQVKMRKMIGGFT